MALVRCVECGKEISSAAASCPSCGYPLSGPSQPNVQVVHVTQQNAQAPVRRWSPGVAVVLSFFIPGLGQMYKGQILNGIAWLIVVPVGYLMLIIPGMILHLCCIIGAAMGDPYK